MHAQFKSGNLFIQSVPAKFKVSRPVLGDFAPPSSPQPWNIYSLMAYRLAKPRADSPGSIWLCVWVGLMRIYYYFLHRVCHKMLYLPLIVTKTEELVYFCHNTITIYLQMYPEIL